MFKLFGMLENFFYISLGITFALILLLVYHFKQRLSAAEKKSDTMYEIITNVVQELNMIKSQLHHIHAQQLQTSAQTSVLPPFQTQPQITEVVVDDHEEESDDEEDSEDDYESDSEDMDDDDDDDDATDDEPNDDISVIKYELIEVAEPPKDVVSQVDIAVEDLPEVASPLHSDDLKIENVDIINLEEEKYFPSEIHDVTPSHDVTPTPVVVEPELDTLKDIAINSGAVEIKKMNITQLRSLAATKFPDVDTSKMKKADIIKLVSE